jgi:hypothetical protein
MAVSSTGLRLNSDCSGKAQKQLNSKLQMPPFSAFRTYISPLARPSIALPGNAIVTINNPQVYIVGVELPSNHYCSIVTIVFSAIEISACDVQANCLHYIIYFFEMYPTKLGSFHVPSRTRRENLE